MFTRPARARVTEARVSEAVVKAAAESGLSDPYLAPRLVDRNLIEVTPEGRIRQATVTAAVAAFMEAHPEYPTHGPQPVKGGTPPAPRRQSAA